MGRINKLRSIAIIPARGGSKRLPRKNILPLRGIPLLTRVIRKIKQSSLFDEIIVSTEDKEITNIAKKENVLIHDRPNRLATDYASVTETCLEVLSKNQTDIFCCIYATAVLIKIDTLQKSFKKFLSDNKTDVLMGVSKYNFHPLKAMSINKNGNAKLLFPKLKNTKSQKFPLTRVSNGTFYWARSNEFSKQKTFYAKRLKIYDVPNSEVSDLDTYEDFIKLKNNFT